MQALIHSFRFFIWLSLGFVLGCERTPSPETLEKPKKWVAITLDDGPLTHYYSYPDPSLRWDTVQRLIEALKMAKAPATLFVIGREMEVPEMRDMIYKWAAAGVDLGNHTYQHKAFEALDRDAFQADLVQTNAVLQPFVQRFRRPIRYFRYPFLQEGASPDRERESNEIVRATGLKNARVTIGTEDWAFNEKYMAAELAKDWAARYEIGQAYLAHIRKSVVYWDSVGTALEGRPIRHVFMVHANRINRDYLGQILADFKDAGFSFISLDEAYRDRIYQESDEWASPTGVSYLEHIKQSRLLRGELR